MIFEWVVLAPLPLGEGRVRAPRVSMNTSLEVLEAEVLQPAPADRSRLLERLVASLDSDPEVEEAWEREADRREGELESGAVAAVPGHEAIARFRARYPFAV